MNKYQTITCMYDNLNHLWTRNSLQFGAVPWNYFKHVRIINESSWVRITRLLAGRIVKGGAQLSLPQKSCRREDYVRIGLAAQLVKSKAYFMAVVTPMKWQTLSDTEILRATGLPLPQRPARGEWGNSTNLETFSPCTATAGYRETASD